MSTKALSEYTIYSRYARYREDKKRRETWEETCDRVFDGMHNIKYADKLAKSQELRDLFAEAKEGLIKKRILGSQRALQFGGSPILKHNAKIFNCSFGHICYPRVFNEIMYLLMNGCGVGFSVQKHHIHQLPIITPISSKQSIEFIVEDSIEGWADAIGVAISSYMQIPGFDKYYNHKIDFNFSQIRPAGALIANSFKAPGSAGLSNTLNQIRNVIESRIKMKEFENDEFSNKLRPIDAYDIVMHMSDAVLSGGVRRAATISLFSVDDEEMMKSKTGNWINENSQRARSNNSVVLIRDEVTKDQFDSIKSKVREFGEPGFVFVDDRECGVNPCCEISFRPITPDGRHGFQMCNLSTVNGKYCTTEERFYKACRAAAIIGTIQAGYTDFKYVQSATKEITEYEALLGVSITGIMDSPEITLNADIQRKGAQIVKDVNKQVAELLGIRRSARSCCIKPEGSSSCILGTSSGIHPHHAKRYFRRVQANKLEFPVQYFSMFNPRAIEESVWSTSKTDHVITFLCEVPVGSIIKNQLGAIELLENVKLTQQNWVEAGTSPELGFKPYIRHNVSNTITVKEEEWDEVFDYLFENKHLFCGVSLLPISGDKDYPQAPFCTVHTPIEMVREYGDASMFASGMITAALRAFDNNLWSACSHALGIEELIDTSSDIKLSLESAIEREENYTIMYEPLFDDDGWKKLQDAVDVLEDQLEDAITSHSLKQDWIRRAQQFADRYFNSDVRKMTYCLKDVYNWKMWCDLNREYVEVDWSKAYEETSVLEDIDTLGAIACSGSSCELK